MFLETSTWMREAIAKLDLPENARVLDVGSSTLHYRTVEQPNVDEDVYAPLRSRGARITHLDVKQAPGVDRVFDLGDTTLDPRSVGLGFDLVITASVLPHVPDPARAVELSAGWLAPGGYLLVTCPERYRRTFDPHDSGLRLGPDQLASWLASARSDLCHVRSESVRIDGPHTYRGIHSRLSWIHTANGRWVPLPGFSEAVRLRVPRWRWRDSVALLRLRRPQESGSKRVGVAE